MEYVIDSASVVRNHALQNAKISKELAEKLCAEFWFKYRLICIHILLL